jgi:hypothetical protein
LHGIDVASQEVTLSWRPAPHIGTPPSFTTAPELELELELPAPELEEPEPELELDPPPLELLLLELELPPLELLLELELPLPELLLELELPPPEPELELDELELEADPPLLLELEKPGLPVFVEGLLLQAETTVPPTIIVAAHAYKYEETRIASPWPARPPAGGAVMVLSRESTRGRTRISKRGGLMREGGAAGLLMHHRDVQETIASGRRARAASHA